jgi:hypothetical protein
MGKVKDAERQKVNKAAETYLCDQPSGDLYDAYKELKDAQDDDNGWKIADNYVVVWQPLTHMTVDEIVDLIEAGIQNAENDEHPAFMQNMDWELLRQQKKSLLGVIDAVQDYAVDIMGVDQSKVYLFEEETEE